MKRWNTMVWWKRAAFFSIAWLVIVGFCGGGILLLLRNSLGVGDRFEIQSVFASLAGAGVCALWLAYWMGRKSMPGLPSSEK